MKKRKKQNKPHLPIDLVERIQKMCILAGKVLKMLSFVMWICSHHEILKKMLIKPTVDQKCSRKGRGRIRGAVDAN